ncbi:hypothetical protein N7539_002783 [Penicillium diatomitis]|uniref:DNA mismatch repair protein MSH5 n=1 Tax=Penicillium diatomitis TaxID=2819901 RepID=A0A9X0BZ10_9EURO|nr:uncharacterized protein N7539_002783 [Penicillium diatomitis]KAJ5491216.1 hypothetical protein N7539_002783 [Penicillium diatomitis]
MTSTLGEEDRSASAEDDMGHVIAAVDTKDQGTVGCAYYVAEKETLFLLSDGRYGGMEVVDALLHQIKPTIVLKTARVEILSAQGREQSLAQDNESTVFLPYKVETRPGQEFDPSSAQASLISLKSLRSFENRSRFLVPDGGLGDYDEVDPEDIGFSAQEGRLLHVSSSVDLENIVSVGCAGAVLADLQRRRALTGSVGVIDDNTFKIRHLEMFSLRDTMWMSRNAFLSLQVMQSELHPNLSSQVMGAKSAAGKEGFSVYGLFNRFAYTSQGKANLKHIFLRPTLDVALIRDRQKFIGVFSRPDNMATTERIIKSLKHIKNLRPVIMDLQKGISTGSAKMIGFKATVWASLLAFAFHSIDIHDALREMSIAQDVSLRTKAMKTFEAAQLYRVGRIIQEIVDIDNSEEQGRTVVKQGLDRELDKMKDRYDGLNSLLKNVAIEIASIIPEQLEIDVNVIYFPQLGFNIAIPLNDSGHAAYSGADGAWELVFLTETRAYFKDFRMKELDDKLGDIYGLICEKEIEIAYDMAQRILHYEEDLVKASDVSDSLLAMTQAANFYKLSRPSIVTENVIDIRGGRHLLQELAVPSYVPNSTLLEGGGQSQSENGDPSLQPIQAPSMLILTGPNYSGKSVYMKQVALIVFLAQIGSFVPAEKAELGITDKILTRVNRQESVSNVQSTFMGDLQEISLCLKQATGQSLVLIDEFGKGTNEADGIGLVCGVLEHLLELESRPKVIAATHFHEIFENDFLSLRPGLQLGHMEVKVSEESRNVKDQVTYLYNFRLGRSNKSFGTICAAINGVDAAIVERANEIALLAARGENLIAACAVLSAQEVQTLHEANAVARKFVELDLTADDDASVNETRRKLQELLGFAK